ncbi:fumarylacetoacetase [Streptomyces sp. RFCAC02]|uniref:fumarylacetoacetase n=1 Tax=Streptomyces sp. RFCAC02 TaxID=2499143 RepID=UPI0010215CEA|nr:fumarylacetoacetase [Streptomyces sp. RFCAC02]
MTAAPTATTWLDVPPGHPFGVHTLPYGSFRAAGLPGPRTGVAIGDLVLDLTAASAALLPGRAPLFAAGTLDGLLAAGAGAWAEVRAAVTDWLTVERFRPVIEPLLRPAVTTVPELPFTVADFTDFYASEHHAARMGRLLRPGGEPLTPNWRHMPLGYHGRAGSVVVSGTPVTRPSGQRRDGGGAVTFGPSLRLDFEAEVGFVVGTPAPPGRPVPLAGAARHLFGVCLVNDWSARDLQAWEYVPLGPFLGKAFATSVSPWVVPLAALAHARTAPPPRDPRPLPYLDDTAAEPWGLAIDLTVTLNGHTVARPPFAAMYWTAAQQVAHLTAGGAPLRTGDLLASGTVSGPGDGECGSLAELTGGGTRPLTLPDGTRRAFLHDGDEVTVTADAPGPAGTRVGLGEVRGRVTPAVPAV